MNVIVLGASDTPERFSNKAIHMLQEKGHTVFPVHPKLDVIDGVPVFSSLAEVPEPVDTISLYLSKANSDRIAGDIVACGFRRLMVNPGAENPALEKQLQEKGVEVVRACTLVMLGSGQF